MSLLIVVVGKNGSGEEDMCKTTMSPQKQRRQRLGLDGATPGSLLMHEICAHILPLLAATFVTI